MHISSSQKFPRRGGVKWETTNSSKPLMGCLKLNYGFSFCVS